MARKKIGLALSGGGARGFAHIGVLKALVENEIPIDMIAGTSAGSIAGGAFAAGMSVDEIAEMASNVGYANMMLPALGMTGMFSNAPMGKFLTKHFPVTQFEEMSLPFAATAFDLEAGEMVVFKDSGDLITAIRSSCAVPGVFTPVLAEDGRLFVDGGVASPLPVETVKEMGADIIIAVDLMASGSTFRANSKTVIGIMIRSTMSLLKVAGKHEQKGADIVIVPPIAHIRPDQIRKADELMRLGEDATLQKIEEIKNLL